jgi:hypothetical protein
MNGHYSPNGRCHAVLRRLAQGTASFEHLQSVTCAHLSDLKRKKLRFITRAMAADGLIDTETRVYRILAAGREALRLLDAGQPVKAGGSPTVRIFIQPEAVNG